MSSKCARRKGEREGGREKKREGYHKNLSSTFFTFVIMGNIKYIYRSDVLEPAHTDS